MSLSYLALEIKRIVRSPQFALFTIGMPLAMFLLFGGIFGAQEIAPGISTATVTMVNMAAYGAMTAALFTGTRVATERTDGWQRTLRLTPMRAPGYLMVKVSAGLFVALPVLLVIFAAGMIRGIRLETGQWLTIFGSLWLGALPFAVLGLMIGLFGKGDTVQAVTGALMLPLGMFGGLWIPLQILPGWMNTAGHIMPTYWLGEIGRAPVLGGSGVLIAAGVLAAWLVVPALVVMARFRLDTARL
ncbi:ABC transporter permease [Amycolatopsis thailandensis]|uniref:ABC transporter n=1 Tax=Amycolatopsis thailandensis TaxID=589330 RepID=A0A229SIH6_9PSEU|nr:ABC transporter permease [Amycolatopsis thailandensis]OXM58656.1 ABC transporter [Amycolatopsis thailandensis]